jgi:23S rRNA pseudouridine1911/1915/1917 synthase
MEITTSLESNDTVTLQVPEHFNHVRLDAVMTMLMPEYSRNFFQTIIKEGLVLVNNKIVSKSSCLAKSGDTITISFPSKREVEPVTVEQTLKSKNLNIEVIYEHEHFLVVYKPANIMVHAPTERSAAITLVDWLIVNYPKVREVGYSDRPGIVHRIDKDTSGLLIISRTAHAHALFSKLFKERQINKTYVAVVEGHPAKTGTIKLPIGRSPQGNKMAAFPEYANSIQIDTNHASFSKRSAPKVRHAVTHYKVIEYFESNALVEAVIETGRTHQIRVHFASLGHSIVGDPIYGKKSKLIKRQALHAYRLSFIFDGQEYNFTKEIPEDMQELIAQLKK